MDQIGGFHAISGDTNNSGEVNKCWWTNRESELMSHLLFTVHQHGGDDVTCKTTSSAVLSLGTVYFSNNLRSADEIVGCEHLTKSLWKTFHTGLSVFEDVITPTLDENFSEL